MDVPNLPAYPPPRASSTYSPPDSDTFPSADELDASCYRDSYSSLSDYVPNGFDANTAGPCFSRPGKPVDTVAGWSAPVPNGFVSPQSVVGTAAPGAPNHHFTMWQTGVPTPLSTSGDFQHGYIPPDYSAGFHSVPSPLPTPSHGSPTSPSPVTASLPDDATLKPAPRKRGRPRLHRPASDGSAASPVKAARTQCMPHTEVERKYREKLNAELERLRKAVPMLPQSDSSESGGVKPSKSMVLAVAIDYIKELERQRDLAVEEVERLGGKVKFGRPGTWRKDVEDA
ncbi:hypothetical protein ACJQWK_07483 [Exserohilum turcicum]|uniref:BHLH domain-containing protein n=1 Tax=Exserohilum turcicum (strain 28A) TaxID=671987 RepID=R0JIN2_EXST2|nr:uncharacterized protein SETTUDRAFT_158126 [Exserohilum turcica Et28A]EOA81198.1 hypothetical protein SETTUDRAFT_158126 [Exserohilum turcica Et28A]